MNYEARNITSHRPSTEDSPKKIFCLLEATSGDVVAALLLDFVKEHHCNATKEHKGDKAFL